MWMDCSGSDRMVNYCDGESQPGTEVGFCALWIRSRRLAAQGHSCCEQRIETRGIVNLSGLYSSSLMLQVLEELYKGLGAQRVSLGVRVRKRIAHQRYVN